MLSKNNFFKFLLLIGDIFLMYLALLLTLAIRYGDFSFLPGPQTKIFLFHFSLIYLFWLLILFIFDFYNPSFLRKTSDLFRNSIIFLFLAGAVGTIYFYLQPQLAITPKTILFLDVLFFTFFSFFWRIVFIQIFKFFFAKEKIIIIGAPSSFSQMLNDSLKAGDYQIIAFYNPSSQSTSFSKLAKYGIISEISKLKEIIEKEGVNTISFTLNFYQDEKMVKEIFLNLSPKLNFINFTDFYETLTKKVPIEAINELWLLENISRVERKIDEFLKRSFDIIFSIPGIIFTILIFPFITLAIKIDSPGPVFYIQKRVGKDRKIFNLYKFRTMKVSENQDKEFWREKDPSQITRIGKFLRKFYLDETPQFFHILKGDLSFVGPRPEWLELAKIFEKEIPFYSLRYLVKPGLTGWAQLNFPPSTSIQEAKEKFQYDLYYIKNRSFLLDLEIILQTMKLLFK
jgi:exopolysaccharide biosynthesis polyprenyl glycosylphosphotransferase